MKRRIHLGLCCISLATALLVGVLSAYLCREFGRRAFRESVRIECETLAALLEKADEVRAAAAFLHDLPEENGIYAIYHGSIPIYLSDETTVMDKAVDQAIRDGQGEIQTSRNGGYVYAISLKDGYVLRLEHPYPGALPYILTAALLFLAVGGLGCLLSLPLSKRLSSDSGEGENRMVLPKGKAVQQQLAELSEERDTINQIMDTMREGLVLISRTKKILIVNQSAVSYLNAGERDYTYESIVALTRNSKLLAGIDEALAGKSVDGLLESDSLTIQFFADPALNGREVTGVILFLVDVTAQRHEEILREEFSANVSHELRSPLAQIVSRAETIQRGVDKHPSDTERLALEIKEEAKRLTGLVDDMMRLSRITYGNEGEDKVKVNLYTLVRGVCMSLAEQAEKKGVEIQVTGKNLIVEGNLGMLHEMVQNICDNALRYNVPKGRVEISVEEVDGKAVLTVSDTGIGISPENLAHVFERFFRVEKARSKQFGGVGLGLSLAKNIAEYHGGTIGIESEEGRGTTVKVTL